MPLERDIPLEGVTVTGLRRGTFPGRMRVFRVDPREPRGRERRREQRSLAPPIVLPPVAPYLLPEIRITPRPTPPSPPPRVAAPVRAPWLTWLVLLMPLNTRQTGRRRPGELPYPDEEPLVPPPPPKPPPSLPGDDVPFPDWEDLARPQGDFPPEPLTPRQPFVPFERPPREVPIELDPITISPLRWDDWRPLTAPRTPAPGPSFAPTLDPRIDFDPLRIVGPETRTVAVPATPPGNAPPDLLSPAFPGPGVRQDPRRPTAPRVVVGPRRSPGAEPSPGQQLDPFPQPQPDPLRADPCACDKPKKKPKDKPKPRLECKQYTVRQLVRGSLRFNVKSIPCR